MSTDWKPSPPPWKKAAEAGKPSRRQGVWLDKVREFMEMDWKTAYVEAGSEKQFNNYAGSLRRAVRELKLTEKVKVMQRKAEMKIYIQKR